MKFMLNLLLLTVNVQALSLKPQDQKHLQQSQQSLNWIQEYLGDTVDKKGCGNSCECPYQCGCQLQSTSPDLDDYENVDDLDVWELNVEDPHECCGCVCGCYNHKAAEQIKKLEVQRQSAKKLEVREKVTADEVAVEKKDRAEAHISAQVSTSAMRIKKAESARAAAVIQSKLEIEAARAAAAHERLVEEGVIKAADDIEHVEKLHAEQVEHEVEMSIDDRIEAAEKAAAIKKAEEEAAYKEKLRLEKIADHTRDLAKDDVRAAQAALALAKVKHARAVNEAALAAENAECYRSCVTEENCATCHKDEKK